MNVNIDLQKGTTSLVVNEDDMLFSFGNQVKQTNEYINKVGTKENKFVPFSIHDQEDMDPVKAME